MAGELGVLIATRAGCCAMSAPWPLATIVAVVARKFCFACNARRSLSHQLTVEQLRSGTVFSRTAPPQSCISVS